MTPKKKAKELVDKYMNQLSQGLMIKDAKKCAIIAIDEIMTFVPYQDYKETISPYDDAELSMDYWQEVKDAVSLL